MDTISDSNWILTVGTFLPLAGALVIMFFTSRDDEQTPKIVGIATMLATAVIGAITLIQFDYDRAEDLQFFVDARWIEVINSRYIIGVDGISLPLYILSIFTTLLVMIYSWDNMPEAGNPKAFYALMLILQTGMAGTFVAQDLILFFVFFEVVLLPMYFMIGVWGGEQRKYASLKFFLYTMFGSAFMLVAFLALYFQAGGDSFGFADLIAAGATIDRDIQIWIFAGMFLGFAVKVPMFPFHTWLPDAHTQAPTQGSVILAAILLKLGTYGFVRIAIPMLPKAAVEWAPVIAVLAVVGIIYGALGCLAQTDMKRLIAFSSVAHMGFVMLGISTLTTLGINAAIFGMVAHGLITGMLFFLAGSIKHRYHTLEINRLSGMLIQMPRLGWILGFCAMASLGLPGLAGFWGEFPAILSAYNPLEYVDSSGMPGELSKGLYRTLMVIAAVGTVFAAAYLLWLYQRTAFGVPSPEFAGGGHDDGHGGGSGGDDSDDDAGDDAGDRELATSLSAAANAHADAHDAHDELEDVTTTEWISWAPFLVMIVALGVYPQMLFGVTDPAVIELVETVTEGIAR